MTLDSGYRLYLNDRGLRVWLIAEPDSGDIVGAFYRPSRAEPGHWRGHAFGRARYFYLPGAEIAAVAARFLSPDWAP